MQTSYESQADTTQTEFNILYPDLSAELPDNSVDGLFAFDPASMGLSISETLMPGMHFAYYKRNTCETKRFRISNPEPYISLVYSIRNKSRYTDAGSGEQFARFDHRQHNLLYIPDGTFFIDAAADENAESFVINFSIERFSSMIPDEHPLFRVFRRMVEQNRAGSLAEFNMPVRPSLQSILMDILHSARTGYYKSLFVRAKVTELLMLQLEQSEMEPEPLAPGESEEVKRMYEVKALITGDLASHVSIIELAKKVGTNDCYLKKQFKEVFGTTVYGYLHKERMEKARQMLGESNRKISEVAKSIGYKHASHFSLAFKKYFGYLPNKIRMLIAALLCGPDLMLVSEWGSMI